LVYAINAVQNTEQDRVLATLLPIFDIPVIGAKSAAGLYLNATTIYNVPRLPIYKPRPGISRVGWSVAGLGSKLKKYFGFF
jgi:hypothetical protein